MAKSAAALDRADTAWIASPLPAASAWVKLTDRQTCEVQLQASCCAGNSAQLWRLNSLEAGHQRRGQSESAFSRSNTREGAAGVRVWSGRIHLGVEQVRITMPWIR